MKRSKTGSTPKQYAYAVRRLNGAGSSKKEIAKLSGYSTTMAENAKHKIEDTDGYKNAVAVLAHKSNNLLLAVMNEFEVRGLSDFSNKDLVSAMNAIAAAWDRVDTKRAPNLLKTAEGNPLRAVFTRRVETQTATLEEAPAPDVPASASRVKTKDAEFKEVEVPDLDF